MIHQPVVSYPKNIEVNFPEGQLDKESEINSPASGEAIEQEYTRPTENHYRVSPYFKTAN